MNPTHQPPLYTLPPELTSLIFTFATHNTPDAGSGSGSLVPLKISHVSRHWRAIALSTGSLWTSITISPSSNHALISTYLARSSPYPIDLTYTTTSSSSSNPSPSSKPTPSPPIDTTFALLAPHLPRLRSFTATSSLFQDTHSPSLTRLIFLVSARPLPLLRELTLDRTGSAKVPLCVRAPRLTHLRISGERALVLSGTGAGVGAGVGGGGMDLGHLTTLHLNIPMSYAQFGMVVAACPALTTLAIYERNIEDWPAIQVPGTGAGVGTGVGGGGGRIDLPGLRSLQLYGHRLTKISEILLAIGAPALRDLVIAPIVPNDLLGLLRATQSQSQSLPSSSPSSPTHTYTSTQRNRTPHSDSHFPALESLTIAPAHSSALKVLHAASECFPSVRRLAFANVYLDGFRDAFGGCGVAGPESESNSNSDSTNPNPTQVTQPLFPNLQTLSLRQVSARMGRAVCEVVESRMRAGVPMKSVCVDAGSYPGFKRGFESGFEKGFDSGVGVGRVGGGGEGEVGLEKRDVWEEYRVQALFRDVERQFVGRFDDDDDD